MEFNFVIRDLEIKRLILYAKAMGVKITIRNYAFDEYGEFGNEPCLSVNINKRVHSSKTELIMTLLHELSHCRFSILNNRPLSEGWILEDERVHGEKKKVPKKLRKEIMDFEVESLELMSVISAELNLKIPLNKIKIQQELDQWAYVYYYDQGDFPTENQKKIKLKELQEKYK